MDSRVATRMPKGRRLLQAAVATVVALGAPVALAGTADAAHADGRSGTASRSARAVASGTPPPGTATTVACSSRWAPGRRSAAQGSPHKASKSQQIAVAERILAKQGWKAWPACSRKAGYRR